MLRSIFSAIASAFAAGVRLFGTIVMAPFRLVDRMLFGGGGEPIEIPKVAAPEVVMPPKPVEKSAQFYEDLANAVRTWCADSIILDAPAPVPPRLPREIKNWLPGLTRSECDAIIEAEKTGVSSHLKGVLTLPGVRPVQPLNPLRAWPAAPRQMRAPHSDDLRLPPCGTRLLDP
jgi:hypothetical protein